MKVKVTEIFPGEHSLALLLQTIPTDTVVDAFGQSAFTGEIYIAERFAYEEDKSRSQRIFVAKHATTSEMLAICFAYPMMIEGRMDPKIKLMLRQSISPHRQRLVPNVTLKVDLRVTDPKMKTQGIGRGFTNKIMKKYLFAAGTKHQGAIALVEHADSASVAFASSYAGKVVAEMHGRLLFYFDAERLIAE